MAKTKYLKVSDLAKEHGVSRQRVHALIRAYGVKYRQGADRILHIAPAEAAKIPSTKARQQMGKKNVNSKA